MRSTLAIHTARAKPRRRRQLLRKARERLERVGGPAIVPVPFFLERYRPQQLPPKPRRGIHSAKGRFAHDTLALAWRRGGTTAGTGQALDHKAATHLPTTWPLSPQQTMQAR